MFRDCNDIRSINDWTQTHWWYLPVIRPLHRCKGVRPLTHVDVALFEERQSGQSELQTFPTNMITNTNYLILGFHQRRYCVIPRLMVDHFFPYLSTKCPKKLIGWRKKKKENNENKAAIPKQQIQKSWVIRFCFFFWFFFRPQTSTLMSFSSSASRKSSVTGSRNLAVWKIRQKNN